VVSVGYDGSVSARAQMVLWADEVMTKVALLDNDWKKLVANNTK
jgi:hypothetical protein